MHTNEQILNILLGSIKSRGITEKDCLLSTSINTSFLTDWKKGRFKTPSYDKVIKLAQYLNISLDCLFLDENHTPSPIFPVDEAEWLTIYQQTPKENRSHLLAMAKAFSQSIPKKQAPLKTQLTSTSTDEDAAAIQNDESNIA